MAARHSGYASTLQPELVLTDLHMPGTGRRGSRAPPETTAKSAHRFRGDLATTAPEAQARCTAAGADAFLVNSGNLAPRLLSAIQEFFPDDLEPNDAELKHLCESLTTVE